MKLAYSKYFLLPSIIALTISVLSVRTIAQTPAVLGINVYSGLSITGAVGTIYSIQYVTDIAQTNNASAWRSLEFLQLPANPYLWTDKSFPATGQRFYRAVSFPAPTNMVFIPPGTFRMGSPTNEGGRWSSEGPQTEVTISRGFWMGRYEVTQREYQAVMGNNPSLFTGDLDRPVEQVQWYNATNYCNQLTQQERAAGRIGSNTVYRLPTEAEWEYACRGWSSTRFSYGDDPGVAYYDARGNFIIVGYTNLTNYAWYEGNAPDGTRPVGQKLPNPWGLYDMHGNVWEWCQDWSDSNLPGGIVLDPNGPALGYNRVIRGGSYTDYPYGCRSARRSSSLPTSASNSIGFRVVLAPTQP